MRRRERGGKKRRRGGGGKRGNRLGGRGWRVKIKETS